MLRPMLQGAVRLRPYDSLYRNRTSCRRFSKKWKIPILGSRKAKRKLLPTAFASRLSLLMLMSGSLYYAFSQRDYILPLSPGVFRHDILQEHRTCKSPGEIKETAPQSSDVVEETADDSAWNAWLCVFSSYANRVADVNWASISDTITDCVVPEWAKSLPGYFNKLQLELFMAPGSLADEMWQEARDPCLNPEIDWPATVRVSNELCDEEKGFLRQRRVATTKALAKYLGLQEDEVHPEDVPCIAIVGSGGGLRACIAGAGSLLASVESGLFDCAAYTAGVSGSCWLQALYHSSSIGNRDLGRVVQHLKNRLSTHIAYPPAFFSALNSAPTNKFLLRGFMEKLKGDVQAEFGLVDIYGVLLAARFLVPKGELGVNGDDLKLSNQREFLKHGKYPLPLYTAVRHEIPVIEEVPKERRATNYTSEGAEEKAKQESWFQWFEITPFEFFCEEFGAGIPTWAMGRKFKDGHDIPLEDGMRVPEIRLPLLLGIFGSAFCATLNLYYKEVRPLFKGLTGFGGIDEMVQGRSDDLSKVHPIDPASIPNPFYHMKGKLPATTPDSVSKDQHIQLMDAGMSNNLAIYPLLRPGRDVDIIIVFDASADIKTENWLSVVDGYALQRGINAWPLGAGWPKEDDTLEQAARQLEEARAVTPGEAKGKLQDARAAERNNQKEPRSASGHVQGRNQLSGSGLGYCTVWVGSMEQSDLSPPESKAVADDWELMRPDAGIAVVYFPLLSNPCVKDVDPATSPFMSTWNFVYTPQEVDSVVALAKANFEKGREQTKRTVRAIYERKRQLRETQRKEGGQAKTTTGSS